MDSEAFNAGWKACEVANEVIMDGLKNENAKLRDELSATLMRALQAELRAARAELRSAV
jgi:hypothetical protein